MSFNKLTWGRIDCHLFYALLKLFAQQGPTSLRLLSLLGVLAPCLFHRSYFIGKSLRLASTIQHSVRCSVRTSSSWQRSFSMHKLYYVCTYVFVLELSKIGMWAVLLAVSVYLSVHLFVCLHKIFKTSD